jgi:hypothetical protein
MRSGLNCTVGGGAVTLDRGFNTTRRLRRRVTLRPSSDRRRRHVAAVLDSPPILIYGPPDLRRHRGINAKTIF